MRILFVGDYDLAGEAIATRLYREGNRICWLTQEKQKKLWSSRIAGRVFRRDISYRTCRQIMQGESIDCVVILTAPWREKYLETESEEVLLGSVSNIPELLYRICEADAR